MIRVTTLSDLELARLVEHLAEHASASNPLAAAALEIARRMRRRLSTSYDGHTAPTHIQPNHLQEY